jgi:hypothetical protein
MTSTNENQIHGSIVTADLPTTTAPTIAAVLAAGVNGTVRGTSEQLVSVASFDAIRTFLQSDRFVLAELIEIIEACESDAESRVEFDPMIHDFCLNVIRSTIDGRRLTTVSIIDSANTFRFMADVLDNATIVQRFPLKNEIARHVNALGGVMVTNREAPREAGYKLLRNIFTTIAGYLLCDASEEDIDAVLSENVGTHLYHISDDFLMRTSRNHYFYDNPVTRFRLNNDVHVEIARVSEKTFELPSDDGIDQCSPLWVLSMGRAACGLAICIRAETRAKLLWIQEFGSDPYYEEAPKKVSETYKGSSVVWYKHTTNRFEVRVNDDCLNQHDLYDIEARVNEINSHFIG